MPDAKEFFNKVPAMTFLINGHFGSGKTRQAMSFKNVYAIGFDPSGLDILYQKENEGLARNLVYYDYINPMSDSELREVFQPQKGKIAQVLDNVKVMAEKKEINSILWDGVTYHGDLRWRLINLDEVAKSERTGNVDTQAMYRNLGISLMTFYSRDLLPLASRYGLNVIATCHLKREAEEQVEGTDKKAGKINKLSDVAPMIEGGFRNKIEGLFGASIYLERKIGTDGKPQYLAHCNIKPAFQTIAEGKNRYGLPQSIDITNKNLSEEVSRYINVKQPIVAK